MTIELFWMPGGPYASRCLMTLAAKELPYHSHILDPKKGENRTAEFLAISPDGTLPVLRDGTTIVRESQAIMFYLDRAYPQTMLYGETPSEAAKIMQELCEQQSYAEPILRPFISALFFKRQPAMNGPELTERSLVALIEEVETRLSGRRRLKHDQANPAGWIAGSSLTAADINLYPLLHSVLDGLSTETAAELNLAPVSLASFPAVTKWMCQLSALAGSEA